MTPCPINPSIKEQDYADIVLLPRRMLDGRTVALEETGTPYERKSVDLRNGEQNGEDFRRINPRGQVPVLDADGTVITETAVILTYIGRRFPEASDRDVD